MDVISSKNFNNCDNGDVAVAIGSFDGLHLGHQAVIKKAIEIARKNNMTGGVYSFVPHPLKILKPEKAPKLIINPTQKVNILAKMGVDIFFKQIFTKGFSNIDFKEFVIDILLKQLNVKHIVVGEDFKFGHNGKGHVNSLYNLGNEYGFDVTVIKQIKINEDKISSTKIRQFIKKGKISKAAKYLGRYFQIEGEVVTGDGRGTKIGFPTANISINTDYVLPPDGVYAVYVNYKNEKFRGITNLGYRPTFAGENHSIETYIMEFADELYGTNIKIDFVDFIRTEKRFNNSEELVKQINKDILYTNNLLCYNI